MATAPGVSPWTQSERAPTVTVEPSIAWTVPSVTRRTARLGDGGRVRQHAVRLAPRDQASVGQVRPVGERLGHGLQTRPVGSLQQRRPGQAEDRHRRVVLDDGGHDRLGVVPRVGGVRGTARRVA